MTTSDATVFREAVDVFWRTRGKQATKQRRIGASDQGSRSAVTGGKQMDGFVDKLTDLLVNAGVPPENIRSGSDTTLPGFFRPTKDWDLVVVEDERLIAAVELKSQVGSFGNNFNNRTEEAMGMALDTWTAFREGAFGTHQPWLGYLFLLESSDKSKSPVAVREPHFKVFPDFVDASYAKRYEIFCRKLVLERKYSSTCFLMSSPDLERSDPNYIEPVEELSASQFVNSLLKGVG